MIDHDKVNKNLAGLLRLAAKQIDQDAEKIVSDLHYRKAEDALEIRISFEQNGREPTIEVRSRYTPELWIRNYLRKSPPESEQAGGKGT